MLSKKKVSIVVPVYNVEKYLTHCLDAILTQSYKNLEIVLIDDGSKDSSLSICQKYAANDDRIVVISQENGGVSSARNKGINICSGEYLTFIDSDDLVDSNYIYKMVEQMESNDAEMVISSYTSFVDESEPQYTHRTNMHLYKTNLDECLFTVSKGVICSKLYRMDIIRDHMLFFDPYIHVCEDLLFNLEYVSQIQALAWDNGKLYAYRYRSSSPAHDTNAPQWADCIKVYESLFNKYNDSKVVKYIIFYYLKFLYEYKYNLKKMGKSTKEEILSVKDKIHIAEKERHRLSMNEKCKLFVCKYLISLIKIKRSISFGL